MDDHVGDVRALAADSLLDLARAGVRVVEAARCRRGRASGTRRDRRPCAGTAARAAPAPSPRARLAARRASASASTSAAALVSVSGSRCVWTPAISGTAAQIARSNSSATACASSSDSSPGSLRWSDSSVRPVDVDERDVVHLAHPRHADRGRVRALAQRRVLERLDVDDDVGVRQRALDRRLDRVRGSMPLPDRRRRARRRSPRRRTDARPPAACGGDAARSTASAPRSRPPLPPPRPAAPGPSARRRSP